MAQDAVQIVSLSQRPVCVHGAGRLPAKPLLPIRKEYLLQISIRLLDRVDSCFPKPLHQTILQCPETTLDSPLGLRRVRMNQFNSQFSQSPPDLAFSARGHLLAITLSTRIDSVQAGSIDVARQRATVLLQILPENSHVLGRRVFSHESAQ